MPPRKKAVPAEVRQPQASGDRSDTVVDENHPLEEPPVGDILKEIEERREAVLEAVKAHVSNTFTPACYFIQCSLIIFTSNLNYLRTILPITRFSVILLLLNRDRVEQV